MGRGYGNAGWGYGPSAGPYAGDPYGMAPGADAGFLRDEANAIREELHAIQQRLAELESKGSSSS
jgi:hypothetical protein